MSLLNFLRVIESIGSGSNKRRFPPRSRKLELEALERRAVLTLLDPLAPVLEPLQTSTVTTTLDSSPPTNTTSTTTESPPLASGGSGSGTGGPEVGDPAPEPTSEPLPSTGGSGSGTGDPPPPPPPDPSSGSGIGGAPAIDSLSVQSNDLWSRLVGSVSDADGSVEGLTVFFTIGSTTVPTFTAIVQADGTFSSMQLMLSAGTVVSVHVVDWDGNASEVCQLTV